MSDKLIKDSDIETAGVLGDVTGMIQAELDLSKEDVEEESKESFDESKKYYDKVKNVGRKAFYNAHKQNKLNHDNSINEQTGKNTRKIAENGVNKQFSSVSKEMSKEASKDVSKASKETVKYTSKEALKDTTKEAAKQTAEKSASVLFKTTADTVASANPVVEVTVEGASELDKTISKINPNERIKNVIKSAEVKKMIINEDGDITKHMTKASARIFTTAVGEFVKWIADITFEFAKNMFLSLMPGGWAFYMLLMMVLPIIVIIVVCATTLIGIKEISEEKPIDYTVTDSVNLAEFYHFEMDKFCFMFPMDVGKNGFVDFSSRFACRGSDNHNGMDICCPEGNTIYAISGGTVDIAYGDGGYHGGCGNYVMINHGTTYDGYTVKSRYLHMAQCYVSPGDKVEKGQPIGTVGHTGNTTGRHTCFALILWNGGTCYYYNPMLLWMHHANQVLAKRNGEFETWNLDSSYSHRATDLTHIRLLNGNQSLSNPYIDYW